MRFRYEAIKKSGESLKGEIEASNEPEAYRLLSAQDMTPVALSAVSSGASTFNRVIVPKRVSTRDKAVIVRELATLLAAGVPLAEAVDSIAEAHVGDALGSVFRTIHSRLRAGESLSIGIRAANFEVPEYVHQLVAAGELTGKLAPGLHAGATQMEYEENLRQEIRNALIYPTVLVCSGISAVMLIFLLVVPKFSNLLKNSRANLPEISVWVLQTGLFVKTNLMLCGMVVLSVLMLIGFTLRNPVVRRQLLEGATRLPLVGDWLLEAEIGRWAAMLGILLDNRVPIVRAMELSEGSIALSGLRQKLALALRDLRAGKKLADALALHHTVSALGINLVRVGERSGELPSMLKTLSGLYETAGRARMKRLVILIEPLTILLIGGAIGFIMIAIMLAITSLSSAVH